MGREQDTSGDYGYDLAHEATSRGRVHQEQPGRAQGGPPPLDPPAELGQDLGYDEAHDF